MRKIEDYHNDVWERLLNFVFPDERDLSQSEVQSELQKFGIDIRPAWDKVQMALEHSKKAERARKDLESAKKKRTSTLAKLKSHKLPSIPTIREEMQKWIEEHLAGPKKAAYCRKLESASDEDIKTLLEDFFLLEEFSKDSNDVEA